MFTTLLDAVGKSFFGGTQKLLDYTALSLAGGQNATPGSLQFYSETLTLGRPFEATDVTLYTTQLIDMRVLFPQRFNINSAGSVLFDLVARGLAATAGGWDASRATFATQCTVSGKSPWACGGLYVVEWPWNQLMRFGEFVATQVSTLFAVAADAVRTGNDRIVNQALVPGFREVLTGQEAA